MAERSIVASSRPFSSVALEREPTHEFAIEGTLAAFTPGVRRRVLLVESDLHFARAIAHALHDQGFDVMLAGDGVNAIKRLAYERVDALVVGVELPNEDALAVARFARSRWARMPVLLVTSHPDLVRSSDRLDPPALVLSKEALLDALGGGAVSTAWHA